MDLVIRGTFESSKVKNEDFVFALLFANFLAPDGKSEMVSVSDKTDSVFLIGGSSKKNRIISNVFHFENGNLKSSMDLLHKRRSHSAEIISQNLILVTGSYIIDPVDPIRTTNSVEIFDRGNNSFGAFPSIPKGIHSHTAMLSTNNHVYVCGGADMNVYPTEFQN
ncbi:hypothetical protein P3G55_03730 [Leptospira sp. 96542]|nr:hypothetical protein [Leptospira sp. 96542]